MSAPTTHDPLFVNTRDGVCWERRAVTDSGLGLYAVEGSCKCPEFKMATFVELAAHGIVEWADVLPMPVGPVPQLSVAEQVSAEIARFGIFGAALPATKALVKRADELVTENAELRARIAELLDERHSTNESVSKADEALRVQRDRIAELEHTVQQMVEGLNGHDCPLPNEAPLETVTRWMGYLDTAEARVAELEAERHTTNEALDDAVQEPRARQSCPCPPADQPGPHQVGCPLDGVPVSAPSERPVNELTATFAPVAALRASLEDPHDGPLAHSYRIPHDLPEGCRLSEGQVRELGQPFLDGGPR